MGMGEESEQSELKKEIAIKRLVGDVGFEPTTSAV